MPDVPNGEVPDRYARIAAGFTRRLAGVPADKWSAPSPCPEWTARDVVTHVINTHRRVLASLDGSTPPEVGPEGDLGSEWEAASSAIGAALVDPSTAARTVGGMFGEQSFESLVGRLLCADTLIHTWDLARATGQDDRLDPDAAEKALEFLSPIDEAIRRPGGFAAKLDPPSGSDSQARLIAFAGRQE